MTAQGGFQTFAPRLSDDKVVPIAAARRTRGTDRAADPSAVVPADNLWWRVPIAV